MVELILASAGTALATGLGAIPVFLLGTRAERTKPALLGFAGGAMSVAAIAGLILPGLANGSGREVGIGLAFGVAFLVVAKTLLDRRPLDPTVARAASKRTSLLVFMVLLVHSLPEGFAIGTAYAAETSGLALFVIVAIAVQNIPEGTSVAIPMAAAGYGAVQQFWAAVLTSVPQPIGAVAAYLLVEEITSLLPVSFGFAGGAMLALVALELVPESLKGGGRLAAAGAAGGAAMMLLLSSILGV